MLDALINALVGLSLPAAIFWVINGICLVIAAGVLVAEALG